VVCSESPNPSCLPPMNPDQSCDHKGLIAQVGVGHSLGHSLSMSMIGLSLAGPIGEQSPQLRSATACILLARQEISASSQHPSIDRTNALQANRRKLIIWRSVSSPQHLRLAAEEFQWLLKSAVLITLSGHSGAPLVGQLGIRSPSLSQYAWELRKQLTNTSCLQFNQGMNRCWVTKPHQ